MRNEWDTFQDPSWLSMYAGFGDLPVRHSPLADQFDTAQLADTMQRMKAAIGATLSHAETHRAFLTRVVGG